MWVAFQAIAWTRRTYAEVKEMGRRVIGPWVSALPPRTLQWFFGPKGLKFSEIGCRPPGVGHWDVYCAANEFDLFRELV
jgi:hypothetical protein